MARPDCMKTRLVRLLTVFGEYYSPACVDYAAMSTGGTSWGSAAGPLFRQRGSACDLAMASQLSRCFWRFLPRTRAVRLDSGTIPEAVAGGGSLPKSRTCQPTPNAVTPPALSVSRETPPYSTPNSHETHMAQPIELELAFSEDTVFKTVCRT
jgi:hypothetical protein